jgi:hypothetical protein
MQQSRIWTLFCFRRFTHIALTAWRMGRAVIVRSLRRAQCGLAVGLWQYPAFDQSNDGLLFGLVALFGVRFQRCIQRIGQTNRKHFRHKATVFQSAVFGTKKQPAGIRKAAVVQNLDWLTIRDFPRAPVRSILIQFPARREHRCAFFPVGRRSHSFFGVWIRRNKREIPVTRCV